MADMYKCELCDFMGKSQKQMQRHHRNSHSDAITNAPKFECNVCGVKYSSSGLRKHRKRKHPDSTWKNRSGCGSLLCGLCGNSLSSQVALCDHLKLDHNIQSEIKELKFESRAQFEQWKTQVTTEGKFEFNKHYCNNKGNSSYEGFICHRSGSYTSQATGLRAPKISGTKKAGYTCSAFSNLRINNEIGEITVTACVDHYKHDSKLVRLHNDTKQKLAEMIVDDRPKIVKEVRKCIMSERSNDDDDVIELPGPASSQFISAVIDSERSSRSASSSTPPGTVLPVTCGRLNGCLILDKFVCPGIHVPCIQIYDLATTNLLTPKQFTVQAGGCNKNSEWRHVIFHRNSSLREKMERGQLDFFNHANLCSGLCNLSIPSLGYAALVKAQAVEQHRAGGVKSISPKTPLSNVNDEISKQAVFRTASNRIEEMPKTIDYNVGSIGPQLNKREKIETEEIEITCKELKGTLLMSEFVCPGIHEQCILMEDGELTSPKNFVVKGTNDKYGEWRRMIKYKGVSIRQFMDRKQIDFYDHANFCTGQCTTFRTTPTQRTDQALIKYPDSERGPFIILNCENHVGKLFLELFHCPGFSAQCVERDNQEMITPKQFVVASLGYNHSDYRRAIKVDGISLRTRMERGEIEFHQHEKYCSHRCGGNQSLSRLSGDSASSSAESTSYDTNVGSLPFQIESANSQEPDPDDQESLPPIVVQDNVIVEQAQQSTSSEPVIVVEDDNSLEAKLPIFRDPVKFWKSIKELGLIDEFFKDILTRITQCKMALFNPEIESNPQVSLEVCQQLSLTVGSLGLSHHLMMKLKQQQNAYQSSAQRLGGEVEALKRLAEDQEARRKEAVRKRALFEHLMSDTLAEQSSNSNSSHVTPVSDNNDGPPVKEPKLEDLTESTRSLFDS